MGAEFSPEEIQQMKGEAGKILKRYLMSSDATTQRWSMLRRQQWAARWEAEHRSPPSIWRERQVYRLPG